MWTVIGQDKVVTFLQKSLEKDSLAHAYLLVGLPHVGKMTLAVNLAMAINCEFAGTPLRAMRCLFADCLRQTCRRPGHRTVSNCGFRGR